MRKKQICVRLPEFILDKLKEEAETDSRTISNLIEKIIREYYEEDKDKG